MEIQYIGKTTSRAIVDRIGAHLDLRDSGFLNCLIKRVAKVVVLNKGTKDPVDQCELNHALSQTNVVDEVGNMYFGFIPVYNPVCIPSELYKKSVGKLEREIIRFYKSNGQAKYNY